MEDLVRQAAPYCLAAHWHPEVDREMVMLQAEVSYIEAEAAVAALKRQGADVSPAAAAAAPGGMEEEGGSGVRLPGNTTEQLQDLTVQ
ncbi:uncharacterized protein HaLaN_16978, partial [Haematococcus lacustris]